MYISDLRKDFFDVIKSHERVLVVANFDVDSVCAVKILQWLLKCDHVTYTLVPVRGKTDLIQAFKDNVGNENDTDMGSTVKFVVMINCGGTFDIVDFFEPPEDVTIFVADSHRPTDVCNIYSDGQVRLLMKQEDDEDVPEYDDIFKDSDDEEETEGDENDNGQANGVGEHESDDDIDSNPVNKRRRFDETAILKRRERRVWEEKRTKILFEYQQFSDYGSSTAFLMYELAWKMSRDTNDLLWWAIVGHTEQYLALKTEVERYVVGVSNIRDHVSRLNNLNDQETLAIDCMKVSFDKELNLNLYRHWAIMESLKHTIYTASQFKIWTERGKQRLAEFFAELGLPLAQCEGTFSTMDIDLRNQIVKLFEEKSEKYRLDDITYGSFNATFGFRHKFCAADIVYSTLALMEQNFKKGLSELGSAARSSERRDEADPANSFLDALSSLSRSNESSKILERGISLAKDQLKLVMKQVQNFINLNSIVNAGPFLYAIIEAGTPDSKYFSRPNGLLLLAQFALRGHIAKSPAKQQEKLKKLPLIVSVPFDSEKGLCLVIGVPPAIDRTRKNLLGKAFEQAAKKTSSRYLLDYFDPSVIQLKTEDIRKFLDGLTAILT